MEYLLCAGTMSGTVGTAVNETHSLPAWSWWLMGAVDGSAREHGSWQPASATESRDNRRLTVPLGLQAAALGLAGAKRLWTKAGCSLFRQLKDAAPPNGPQRTGGKWADGPDCSLEPLIHPFS